MTGCSRRALAVAAACAALTLACSVAPPYTATPQRPSYSSDANTTAEGSIEVEAGVSLDDQDAVDLPVNLKWGATASSEVFVSASPYQHIDTGAGEEDGASDLVVGTRIRFVDEGERRPALALQLATKLPTANDEKGFSSGETDFYAAGVLTKAYRGTTVVGFYQFGALGNPGAADVDIEHGVAVALGRSLFRNVSAFIEMAGVLVPDQDVDAYFTTIGLGYAPRSHLVFDLAIATGLSDDASDFVATVGATMNLGNPLE